MPAPGIPNNPEGINNFDHLAVEEPYGAVTQRNRLQQAAPLAGGQLASGPLNAPKKAQQQTQQHAPTQLPVAPPVAPVAADVWQQLAATPGASPLVIAMAARALR